MKTITTSLKKTLTLIKKHKNLIALLFVLQFVFFVLIFYVNVYYQMRIMDSASVIFETLEEQQLSDEDIVTDLFGQEDLIEDSFAIVDASKEVTKNVSILVVLSFIIYVVFGGFIWGLTDNLINKKKMKQFFVYIGKFALITIVYGILAIGVLTQAGRGLQENLSFNYFWLILLLFLSYFLFISYALIGKLKLNELLKQTFLIGVKKAHYILLVYLINIAIMTLLGYIMFLVLEGFILLLTISMILFVLGYVLIRLFLVLAVDGLGA